MAKASRALPWLAFHTLLFGEAKSIQLLNNFLGGPVQILFEAPVLALNNCSGLIPTMCGRFTQKSSPNQLGRGKRTAQAELSLARAAPRELFERRGREAVQFGERNGKRCTLPSQRYAYFIA